MYAALLAVAIAATPSDGALPLEIRSGVGATNNGGLVGTQIPANQMSNSLGQANIRRNVARSSRTWVVQGSSTVPMGTLLQLFEDTPRQLAFRRDQRRRIATGTLLATTVAGQVALGAFWATRPNLEPLDFDSTDAWRSAQSRTDGFRVAGDALLVTSAITFAWGGDRWLRGFRRSHDAATWYEASTLRAYVKDYNATH